jgi:hypothetical protein
MGVARAPEAMESRIALENIMKVNECMDWIQASLSEMKSQRKKNQEDLWGKELHQLNIINDPLTLQPLGIKQCIF